MKLPTRVPLPTPRPANLGMAAPNTNYFPPAPAAPMQAPMGGVGGMVGGARNWIGNNSEALAAMSEALLTGRTPNEQFGGAFGAFAKTKASKKKENETLNWLREQDPATAKAVEMGALEIGEAWTQIQKAKQPQNTEFSQRAVAAQQYGLDPESPEGRVFILTGKMPGADGTGSGEYGLTPQTGVDENGNPVLIQLSKGGTSIRTPLPKGVTLSKEPIKLDAGNEFILLDPITRQPVGRIPKDNFTPAFDKASGDAQGQVKGKAIAEVGGARQTADLVAKQINELKADPALPNVLGPLDSRLPIVRTESARVQSKINQIRGQAFLQARQMLKGGGAITDFESVRAEEAYVRMDQAQSVEDFKAALDDFNAAVQSGVMKLEMQAGGGIPAAPAQQGPISGRTSSGISFTVE